MTFRARVVITVASALILGASTYGHAMDIHLPGALQGVWDGSAWGLYLLAIVGVFLVDRWWALLPAIAPVAVTLGLHGLTNYVSPWGEDDGGISFSPLFILLVLAAIATCVAVLSLGLLLRAFWETYRSTRSAKARSAPA